MNPLLKAVGAATTHTTSGMGLKPSPGDTYAYQGYVLKEFGDANLTS